MAASREDLNDWFDVGVGMAATHMIVVTDQFDWEDYPVYVTEEDDVREVEAKYSDKDMQKVMEVYNLRGDKRAQMAEERAFHYD